MKIINVTITEFAGLSELSLDFCDGLNVVEGLNESGKSSVNAFIKFMLYGLDNSKCFDSPLTERKYYTSWKSGIAQGMMTVEYEGSEDCIAGISRGLANLKGILAELNW